MDMARLRYLYFASESRIFSLVRDRPLAEFDAPRTLHLAASAPRTSHLNLHLAANFALVDPNRHLAGVDAQGLATEFLMYLAPSKLY